MLTHEHTCTHRSSTNSDLSDSQDKLQQALTDFYQLLTLEEFAVFTKTTEPSALSVVGLTSEIDKKRSGLGLRRLGPCFEPFLKSIQRFSSVVEALISSSHQIAALVWGSVKFVVIVCANLSPFRLALSNV